MEMSSGKESAFPVPLRFEPSGSFGAGVFRPNAMGGLTKREYFAGLAMQGLVTEGRVLTDHIGPLAVRHADTLLAALSEPTPSESRNAFGDGT